MFQVNKSAGPFDSLFCVGQFFPDETDRLDELMDYIEGRAQIPLPTYFIGDYGAGAAKVLSAASKNSANQGFKMDGFKICDNLFWLKGSGKFTLHGMFFWTFMKHFLSGYLESRRNFWKTSAIPDLLCSYLGLSVAYLSGRQLSSGQQFGSYSEDDIDALRAFAEEPGIVDLFLRYPLLC